MKKTILSILAAAMMMTAEAQIETPQPSPAGSVYSKVGLTDVTIDYYRPKVKGRLIFGDGADYLQPFGVLWRTGANSGSVLKLDTDAKIGGQAVKAGEYLIFTVPGKDSWDFMLYSDLSLGGNTAGYNKEKEVMRTSVKPVKLSDKVETLTFQITDISEDNSNANIMMSWENTGIKIPVQVDYDAQVMAAIKKETQVNPGNYVAAANYYLATDRDLEQALEWMDMYLAVNENGKQFWHQHTKARILAKMGKKKEAKEVAMKSMEMAKNNPNGDFGYVKRNQDLIDSMK